jgi:hypothetical protein
MSALDHSALALSRSLGGRPLGCAAGVALAAAIEFLVHEIAPEAPAVLGPGLAGLSGLGVVALAFTLEDAALPNLTRAVLAGMGLIVLGALADPGARLRLFSFASAASGVGLAVMLARTARSGRACRWAGRRCSWPRWPAYPPKGRSRCWRRAI